LGGVAIKEACDDAISMNREAISIAERYIRIALQRIASRIDTGNSIENLIVFNSSAFEREETIEFELWNPESSERGRILKSVILIQSDGTKIPTQKIEPSGKIGEDRVRFIAKVTVPAFGWSRYSIKRNASVKMDSAMFVSTGHIGNGIISVDLSNGQADPENMDDAYDDLDEEMDEYEILADAVLSMKRTQEMDPETMERNKSASYKYDLQITIDDESDTWSHKLKSFDDETFELGEQFAIVKESGPVRASVEVISGTEESILRERFMLRDGFGYIELRAGLDFKEQRKLLKFRFPHGCKNPVARYEIPYASIERPVGHNEWPGQSWIDVSEKNGSRGVSIITDSKYSYEVDATYIYVIAARGALYAHHSPPHDPLVLDNDTGIYLDQGWQDIRFLIVPHSGDWREAGLPKLSEQFLQPLIVHTESAHSGDLPSVYSAFESSNNEIRIGAVKLAEDGDGIIVRAVEQRGEENSAKFKIADAEWSANFNPFEIISFLIENGKATEVDLLERPL
jgi:alpha-mannosidase